jgi:hypothetical protein
MSDERRNLLLLAPFFWRPGTTNHTMTRLAEINPQANQISLFAGFS